MFLNKTYITLMLSRGLRTWSHCLYTRVAECPEEVHRRLICNEGERVLQIEADGEKSDVRGHGAG